MAHAFDQDIAISAIDPDRYAITISDRWNIGDVPNGGYLLSIAAGAVRESLAHPDPFSVTGHFFKPVSPGLAEIGVSISKVGRALSFARAGLVQGGVECLGVTAAFGDLDARSGLDHVTTPAPAIPGRAGCRHLDFPLPFFQQMETALTPDSAHWLDGDNDDMCELQGWSSFVDGRAPDVLSLPLFADAFPPPVLRKVGSLGWVPTVEMTVQIRNRPAAGPLQCRFGCRYITGGLTEEDGEIWDSTGRIVAVSRQLASVRVPEPT